MELDLNTLWVALSVIIIPLLGWIVKLLRDVIKSFDARIDKLEDRQNAFEVKVAENYISTERFSAFEQRMLHLMQDMSKKIDNYFFNNRNRGE